MTTVYDLSDLLIEEIKVQYGTEKQLLVLLPRLAAQASDKDLKKILDTHVKESRGRINRLEQIFTQLDLTHKASPCKIAEDLVERVNKTIKKSQGRGVIDAALILGVQAINHFQIASYGTLIAFAEAFSDNEVVTLLQKSLDEEKKTDHTLSRLAVDRINKRALESLAVNI
jgi:ferritin-like metal-binding protein YciE